MAKIKVSKELLEALEELKETITNIIMAHQAIMLQLQQERSYSHAAPNNRIRKKIG